MDPQSKGSGLSRITAAVLVGGLGTRLRSVVSDKPKVLAEVGGKPFLSHLLDQLLRFGLSKVVLCTGVQGEKVRATFGDAFGSIRLCYSQEAELLGTGGALRLALPILDSDPVLVLNGDSYCDVDFHEFLAWHLEKDASASLVSTEVGDAGRFGRVWTSEDGAVSRFEEKDEKSGPGWINAGVYLLGRSILQSIPQNKAVSLEREIFPSLVGRGLFACRESVPFLDIGTPESYAEGEAFFKLQGRGNQPTSKKTV